MAIEGFEHYRPQDAERYTKYRYWLGLTWGDMFDKATDLYPDKVGLVDDTSRLTYEELRQKVDRLAIGFMDLGIGEKDFVLVQIPNWHEYVVTFFALQKIGAIPVLLIARHGLAEIMHVCGLTHPTAWIGPARYRNIEFLPMLARVREEYKDLTRLISVRSPDHDEFIPLETLIEKVNLSKENVAALKARRPDPMEVSMILLTGGTTGLPKAVPRTHNDYIASVEYHSRAWEMTSDDVVLTVAPVSHAQAMHNGVGGAFFNFAKYVLTDSTEAADICKVIERERVTAFPTVPALVQRMVGLENLKEYDLSSLRKIYAGGAPSTPELVQSIYDRLGCKFVNAFGSAEGPGAMTRLSMDLMTVCTTVGKKDCPYAEIRILDQYGEEAPPGHEGELTVKGPNIFTGYFKSAEDNKLTFTSEGFFKTGDLAKVDEKGIITITGRIKETILRGGETISAVGIERLISSHPDVADVAVIGMPDKALGERICAYIRVREGGSFTFGELITYLKGCGASVLQLPERVEFIDKIPLTNIGKADKKVLKEDIRRKLEG
ncbi:MAG TPA: AMP-binding protein [Syntrophorhabdaceae bacterium]|jgi:2,3-dihydroxybenzoate-AMP ligase/mycobactin salicyl-AMP ligase